MKYKLFILLFILPLIIGELRAEEPINFGKFSGNYQLDAQYELKDVLVKDADIKEKIYSSGFFNLNYNNGNFSAGLRYENYSNPLLGFDKRYTGSGFPYLYLNYKNDLIDVTAGNFYEQFGSGMIFRAYEEKQLGIDNAIEGVKFKLYPTDGIDITGIVGKQRLFWEKGDALIRGLDANIDINNALGIMPDDLRLTLGTSFVSRYLADKDPNLKLPENVLAWASRFNLTGSSFMIGSEFGYKINDPNNLNKYSYNKGTALLVQASYFVDGFGTSLNLHRIDNMDFRGSRTPLNTELSINYLPPITKQHSYSLTAMYPFATQLNGEAGLQATIDYTFSKESFAGGKYPLTLTLNYSRVNSIDTTHIDQYKYDSPFFKLGSKLYYQDINLYATKKWNSDFKSNFGLVYQIYDRDLIEKGGEPHFGKVDATIAVVDLTFKLAPKQSIRTEFQHLWYSQEKDFYDKEFTNGNWIAGLVEYTVAPKWYFTLLDEWNYDNKFTERQLHYITANVAYIHESTRFQIGYGRQRAGVLCVGGVCRNVPAASGFNLSITSSF